MEDATVNGNTEETGAQPPREDGKAAAASSKRSREDKRPREDAAVNGNTEETDTQPPGKEGKAAAAASKKPKAARKPEIKTIPRLKTKYWDEFRPALVKEFSYGNVWQSPRVQKVTLNIGMGEAVSNAKTLDAASADIAAITGQHPVITRSKRSISNFKLREGMPIGVMVTLRGNRMWEFLDRLINAALPRIRDFNGVSPNSFDGRGNYSMGLREQVIFPEIEYDKIDRIRGMQITITTTAKNDEEAKRLLELLGMPFAKRGS